MKTNANGQSTEWQTAAQAYLQRVGAAEYAAQSAAATKARRKMKRFVPSSYLTDMCGIVGRNDEESFKARKMRDGRRSFIGV
jgi:hypothetical protein